MNYKYSLGEVLTYKFNYVPYATAVAIILTDMCDVTYERRDLNRNDYEYIDTYPIFTDGRFGFELRMNATQISQLEALVAEKKKIDRKNTFFFRLANYIFNFIMLILFCLIGFTITGYILYYLYYEYDMTYIFQHLVDKNYRLQYIPKPFFFDSFTNFNQIVPSIQIQETNLSILVQNNFDPSFNFSFYKKKSDFPSYLEDPIAYKEFFILKPEVANYLNSYLKISYIGISWCILNYNAFILCPARFEYFCSIMNFFDFLA